MTTVTEAVQLVMNTRLRLAVEEVSLQQAAGRKLAQHIIMDHDLPPFDRVMMDGIGLHISSWEAGQREYLISGIQQAGTEQQTLTHYGQALEVMTGAVVPIGINAIVPYEEVSLQDGLAQINSTSLRVNQHIHVRGSDKRAGAVVAETGCYISPAIIGIAASAGCSRLKVYKSPKIAIVSTGNELVEVDQHPLPHQIRSSNRAALAALVSPYSNDIALFHVQDEEQEVEKCLRTLVSSYDVIILSGGVSKGKYDILPAVLASVGAEQLFHRVEQKPGKPFWFGKKESTVVFAFPGNPVSALFCAYKYLLPWLAREASGRQLHKQHVVLSADYHSKNGWTHFVPVTLSPSGDGFLRAEIRAGHGSGDFAHLETVHGFVEVIAAKEGDVVPYYPIC